MDEELSIEEFLENYIVFGNKEYNQPVFDAMQDYSDQQNAQLKEEIERLKGLIEDLFKCTSIYQLSTHVNQLKLLRQFKETNKL